MNKRIAKLLNIPHVGCLSHKLNLDVNRMIESDDVLSRTLDSVQKSMHECRTKLKNRALLRNITHLAPILPNETRWSGKYAMVERFNRIHDDLIEIAAAENRSLHIESSATFKRDILRANKQLEQIKIIALELHSENNTLSD